MQPTTEKLPSTKRNRNPFSIFTSQNVKIQKRILIVVFLVVPIVLTLMFSYYPALKLFQQSFTDWDGMKPSYNYVGLQNFTEVLKEPETLKTFGNNFAYLVIGIIQTLLALYLAIILNGKLRGRNFFKSIIFMPYILNGVAVAYMFNYIYDYNNGPINVILRNIGLEQFAIKWLGEGYAINFSLAFMGLWQFTGFAMVIFLGALQSIPFDIYEAASLDGATFFQAIRYITLPSVKRVLELNLILCINGAIQAYMPAFLITKGGPAGDSTTFVYKILDIAFKYNKFGKASAMSVITLAIVAVVLIITNVALKERKEAL
ncbi:carbohydrate ABC transporter permease [Clostridium cellulovorans]|uniref:Binding-protein-dependent transport systems inner membrane component n=1 Tax=Clostridium cellulovorans (strain ATCC 35296 / DSM 3052 / OCM 3 / 743B) TaxID=573061 RepID=D9SUD1_CLOC7|nr:sugar ABC transporter permease [Clostridium cellulovorans]ADL52886.1 binding-protein-dependent transport systems inner membrane component [Clostridium cellulovorans 743B]